VIGRQTLRISAGWWGKESKKMTRNVHIVCIILYYIVTLQRGSLLSAVVQQLYLTSPVYSICNQGNYKMTYYHL